MRQTMYDPEDDLSNTDLLLNNFMLEASISNQDGFDQAIANKTTQEVALSKLGSDEWERYSYSSIGPEMCIVDLRLILAAIGENRFVILELLLTEEWIVAFELVVLKTSIHKIIAHTNHSSQYSAFNLMNHPPTIQ